MNIDDCWQKAGTADDPHPGRVDGKPAPDPDKFPHGMKLLTDCVHAKGLKLGIHESAGNNTCQRIYPGSYGRA